MTTTNNWYDDETCIECEEPLDHTDYPEDSDYVGEYGSGSTYEAVADAPTGHICLYCRESWDEHANTLVLVHKDGDAVKVNYSDGILFDHGQFFEDWRPVADSPYEDIVLDIVAGTTWHSTDAWRGHEEGPSDADGWTRVTNTWHGALTRTSASDRINDLTQGQGPLPVAVAFTKTSNVMSIGIEVYAPEETAGEIQAFFEGASAGLDGGRFA